MLLQHFTPVFEESEAIVKKSMEHARKTLYILRKRYWCPSHRLLTKGRLKKLMAKKEEEVCSLDEIGGDCNWFYYCTVAPTPPLEEEGSKFRDNNYNPLYVNAIEVELIEEEERALGLKASSNITMEE